MSDDIHKIFQTLRERQPLPPLLPTQAFSSDMTEKINSLLAGDGVKAAFHLLNDDIQRCHNIAQKREGNPTFDYMHAVLHRRERDFWNSKWWFNRIAHPLLKECYGDQLPQTFVDDVERAEKNKDQAKISDLEQTQMVEMVKLAQYSIKNNL